MFNGAYNMDRIRLYYKIHQILDTIVSSNPIHGWALNYKFRYPGLRIRISKDPAFDILRNPGDYGGFLKDTAFNILKEWSDYKVFLVLNDADYTFAKAKDTTIVTW